MLVARNDVVTVARFVDYLAPATIAAVIASIADELVLLHIATFIDSDAKLVELVTLIPAARLRAMIERVGEHGGELWLEALALASRLDAAWQHTLADLAAELPPALLDGMVAAVRAAGAWDTALPLVAAMSEPGRQRFLALASVDDEVLDGLIGAATRLADL